MSGRGDNNKHGTSGRESRIKAINLLLLMMQSRKNQIMRVSKAEENHQDHKKKRMINLPAEI
jgi:hypothetical protein